MADILGTWRVVALDGHDRHDGVPYGEPWLTFEGDGQVYGHAGVNRVRGTWELVDDLVHLGPMVSTLMAGPDESMATERAVLDLLAGPLVVTASAPDTLQVTASDTLGALLVRIPSPPS